MCGYKAVEVSDMQSPAGHMYILINHIVIYLLEIIYCREPADLAPSYF